MITTGGNHLQPYTQQPIAVIDFTVDGGGSAEPTRVKNIIGMYRRRGSNSPLLCDPGSSVVEDVGQWGR